MSTVSLFSCCKCLFYLRKCLPQDLRNCVKLTEIFDVAEECLCADQLSGNNVLDQLKQWLQNHKSGQRVDTSISGNQHVTILSRFCGPATRPSLTMPGGNHLTFTPTTLKHAVYLTGELFNRTIIHPEHYDVLTKVSPRVFLFGPPGTGKTTSLVLMGKKWLWEGHRVCVLSTWRESWTTSKHLYEVLKTFTGKSEKSKSSMEGSLIFQDLNLEAQDMQKAVNKVMKLSTTDGLFILADDAGPHGPENSFFKTFCENLLAKQENLHLWAASCLSQETPSSDWEEIHLYGIVSCPPTLIRELDLMKLGDRMGHLIKWDPNVIGVAPTDGLPVKYIYHRDSQLCSRGYTFSCRQCCLDVIATLKSFGISAAESGPSVKTEAASKSTSSSTNTVSARVSASTPRLYMTDVLFLCEFRDFEKTLFCKSLKESGIRAKVVKEKNTLPRFDEHNDQHVWFANPEYDRGLKRSCRLRGRTGRAHECETYRLEKTEKCHKLYFTADLGSR